MKKFFTILFAIPLFLIAKSSYATVGWITETTVGTGVTETCLPNCEGSGSNFTSTYMKVISTGGGSNGVYGQNAFIQQLDTFGNYISSNTNGYTLYPGISSIGYITASTISAGTYYGIPQVIIPVPTYITSSTGQYATETSNGMQVAGGQVVDSFTATNATETTNSSFYNQAYSYTGTSGNFSSLTNAGSCTNESGTIIPNCKNYVGTCTLSNGQCTFNNLPYSSASNYTCTADHISNTSNSLITASTYAIPTSGWFGIYNMFSGLNGDMWILNYSNYAYRLSSNGTLSLASHMFSGTATAGCYDSNGEVWIINGNYLTSLDATTGTFVVGAPNSHSYLNGSPLAYFTAGTSPQNCVVDPARNVWVSANGSNAILVFNNAGQMISDFSITSPTYVALDHNNNAWISYQNSGIAEMTPLGQVVANYTGINPAGQIAIDSNNVVYASSYYNVYKISGGVVSQIIGYGPNLYYPQLAIDTNNNLYVSAGRSSQGWVSYNYIYEIPSTGGNEISISSNVESPASLVFDSFGNLWVGSIYSFVVGEYLLQYPYGILSITNNSASSVTIKSTSNNGAIVTGDDNKINLMCIGQ